MATGTASQCPRFPTHTRTLVHTHIYTDGSFVRPQGAFTQTRRHIHMDVLVRTQGACTHPNHELALLFHRPHTTDLGHLVMAPRFMASLGKERAQPTLERPRDKGSERVFVDTATGPAAPTCMPQARPDPTVHTKDSQQYSTHAHAHICTYTQLHRNNRQGQTHSDFTQKTLIARHTPMHTYAHIHTRAYTHAHTHTRIHTRAYTHAHAHKCMHTA